MRRFIAVLLLGALAFACCPRTAFASLHPTLDTPAFDLRAQLLMRLYGETNDSSATFAATLGDVASESPLRNFAFRLLPAQIPQYELPDVADIPGARLNLARFLATTAFVSNTLPEPAIAVKPAAATALASQNDATPAPAYGLYHSFAAEPTTAPASVQFSLTTPATQPSGSSTLTTLTPVLSAAHGFDAGASGPDTSGLSAANATLNVPVHVGRVSFQGRVEGAQSLATDSSLRDNTYGAGANFNVQAGKSKLNVDVASRFEHLTRNDTPIASSSFDGSSTWQLSNDNLQVLVPAFADVSKHTISAGVAVPVSQRLTAGVQYDTQHLLGGYGSAGFNNLDARNDVYGAKLTYALPNSSSLLTFSAKQYRYQDNLIPSNTFTQTREDVNFTVKF
jgi:hypothetical protein